MTEEWLKLTEEWLKPSPAPAQPRPTQGGDGPLTRRTVRYIPCPTDIVALGPFPNPQGYSTSTKLHEYFEGEFVHKHISDGDVKARVKAYHDCGCSIQDRTVAYLMATQAQVIPLYELDKAGAFTGDDPKGKDFAAGRMAAAASELRDMVIDAWRTSTDVGVGYPHVKVRDVEAGKVVPIAELRGRD